MLLARIFSTLRLDHGRWFFLLLGILVAAPIAGFVGNTAGPEAGSESEEFKPLQDDSSWTCSMHPQIRRSEPGQCPLCGMELIKNKRDEGKDSQSQVTLSARAQALAKIRTTQVVRHLGSGESLSLLGRVGENEETLRSITAWTGGRIEKLYVNSTGQKLKAGQVVARLYSPEVFSAHQDLIVAQRQVKRLAEGSEGAQRAAGAALNAARQRLSLLGVPEAQLNRMAKKSTPTRSVSVYAPFSGTVMERVVTEGAYVSTGTPLYRIANLDQLWVQLDAYESDLPRIDIGQAVQLQFDALAEKFEGVVTFVDPTLDATRRTARVRVAVDNPNGKLRPGMFASAELTASGTALGSPLVIPATAALFTGKRAIVYVQHPEKSGTYEARTVRLGPRLADYYPVVAGLTQGERVVSRGAFVIDADLQIRGGHSMMSRPDDSEAGEWDAAITISAEARAQLAPLVNAYLSLQKALAEDSLTQALAAGQRIEKARSQTIVERPQQARVFWKTISSALVKEIPALLESKSLEQARAAFEEVSAVIERLLAAFGNPTETKLHLAYCPMAMGSEGATWIQIGEEIDNSYFGESMRDCGEIQQEISPGTFLKRSEPLAQTGHDHEGHQP